MLETNELEEQARNTRPPKLNKVILIILAYLMLYILIPLLLLPHMLSLFSGSIPFENNLAKSISYFFSGCLTFGFYIIYKKFLDSVFYANGISAKKEWLNYLTFKKLKIRYYTKIMRMMNVSFMISRRVFQVLDKVRETMLHGLIAFYTILFIFFCFMLYAIIWLPYQEKISGLSVGKSIFSVISFPDVNRDLINVFVFFLVPVLLTVFTIFLVIIFIELFISFLGRLLFPMKEGFIDLSDVPVSFIKDAIEKLEAFDFSSGLEKKRENKKKIIDMISYASGNFINVDTPSQVIDYANVSFLLIYDQLNGSVVKDIVYRTNGLYKKIEELCVKIYHMNDPEERNDIVHDLKIYVKIIEHRELSKISPVEFEIKMPDNTSLIVQTIAFINKII